jgi:hypothetical protein
MQKIEATKCRETLLKADHTFPGYYFVHGTSGLIKILSNATWTSSPAFQEMTQAQLAEFAVAFFLTEMTR